MAEGLGESMLGIHLRIFVAENQKHHGELLYEWLIEKAKSAGIPGATVQRAIAGYGRHGTLHEEGFFELAINLPVAIDFYLGAQQAENLLKLIESENLKLFYVKSAAEFGIT